MSEENKKTFDMLNVKQEIVEILKNDGIVEPTSIQEKTIPLVHKGNDVIGISRTGSGKTAAFGVPLLERVKSKQGVQSLILAPTRELANQISGELKKWSKNLNLTVATIFGGVAIDPQIRLIAKSEIVVGTPGRVLDLLERGNLDVSNLMVFVLDEADKMVEMGFIEDIERIMTPMPQDRQILLFGATISNEIDYLKKKYMHKPALAEAELHVKKDLLEQYYYNVNMNQKFSLLVHLLNKEETGRVIIFCSKRSTVELVNHNLREQGIKSEMIHGKMTQNKRLNVIERFNNGKTDYLVASAVAARGLDIKDVTHVFNYDLSSDPQEYIHRVGRTARAGESGKAITLLSPQDHESFYGIFDRHKINITELPLEDFKKLRFQTRPQQRPGRFGNRGQRGNFGRRPQHGGGRNFGHRGSGSRSGHRGGHGFRSGGSGENLADKYGLSEQSSRRQPRKKSY